MNSTTVTLSGDPNSRLGGLVDMYVLVFIHIGSRPVWLSNCTPHPDAAWVAQQARNVCSEFADEPHKPIWLMHDADTKFTRQFDGIFESEGLRVKKNTPASPHLNEFVERFVQTIQQKCLDHFVVLGGRHLNHLVREFGAHYHEERPHQGVGNVPLNADPARETLPFDPDVPIVRLGGLLKHYERVAA